MFLSVVPFKAYRLGNRNIHECPPKSGGLGNHIGVDASDVLAKGK